MIKNLIFFKSSFLANILFFIILAFIYPGAFSLLKSSIPFLLGLVMFFMGLTLNFSEIKKTIKKPQWVSLAVFLQFTIMPLTAFFLINFFQLPDELALGVIILGCCPGGTASNVITFLCDGNIALSIISTFFSTLISVFLTPILIFFISSHEIDIDIFALMKSSFLIVFFPVISGLILKNLILRRIKKNLLPKISETLIALIIGIIFALNIEEVHQLSIWLFVCILFHNLIGLTAGYFIGNYFNFPEKEKKNDSY